MTGVIVAGHGKYGSGITSMLELVMGSLENYEFIDFQQGESQEDLEADFFRKINNLKLCDRILIMTDIMGGSPFKTAVTYALGDEKLEVISGTNIPMLLELLFGRMENEDCEELIQRALDTGKEQIIRFNKKLL